MSIILLKIVLSATWRGPRPGSNLGKGVLRFCGWSAQADGRAEKTRKEGARSRDWSEVRFWGQSSNAKLYECKELL